MTEPALTAAVATATVTEDRTISGLVLPLGPVGYTSVGPVRLTAAEAIRIPEDISRIKLMDYHQTPPVAIGHATALRWTTDGLRAAFHVAATPLGDAALVECRELVRDGLSVELGAIDVQGDELRGGDLLAVALVPIPAWSDARHDGLAAAREDSTTTPTPEETGMTPEERARLAELIAKNARTDEEEAEFSALVRKLATAPEAEAEAPPAELAAARHGGPATAPATVPGGAPVTTARANPGRPVRELFASMSRVLSGVSRPELEAALSDITTTANIWTADDDYAGQLWSGLEYQRRFIPLLTSAPLTSYKGTGWKWVVKPVVADYAGDKAAVPSNAASTAATAWTAARLAGAHDIDRKFWDFGDTEFIAAYYAAMTESYAMLSDDKARAKLVAMAAANTAVTGATTMIGAALRAADAVMTATGGVKPDYFLVNGANLITAAEDGSLSSVGDNSALAAYGVTGDKFQVATGVAAGTVVAGVRQAARFRELGASPIRVETINLVNGGIDGGVFGYYATESVMDTGVQRATFA